jgi:2-polyprenyl-6-hydroxyphenyl methylase/3-demethylubiquinone-9 3-methyltransferase
MDNWMPQEFEERIYNSDYIKTDPPTIVQDKVSVREQPAYQKGKRLSQLIQGSQKLINVLDYGAGGNPGATGLALIEDGFNVRSYEPYRAKGTDAERLPEGEYHLIIAIEVFEHCPDLRDLVSFMHKHLAPNGMMLVQTMLHPHPAPARVLESWYIAPRNGHVSIFTLPALGLLFAHARINIVQNLYGIFGFKSLPDYPNQIFFK